MGIHVVFNTIMTPDLDFSVHYSDQFYVKSKSEFKTTLKSNAAKHFNINYCKKIIMSKQVICTIF